MDLLERDADLGELESALLAARAGRGSLVLVSGEAGIGKTQLVREFTHRHGESTRILWGGCDDLSTPRTLGPFRDIARQVGGEFETLISSGADRTQIFDAALETIGDSGSVTVAVIEDVHWADEATLDVVKFLGRRIDRTNALLVATYREEDVPARHPLRRVIGDVPPAALHRLVLAPLSRQGVATLAAEYEGSVDQLYAATGGNPFFVTEAIQAPSSDVAQSVRDAVAARISRLSETGRSLIEFAAVVPGQAERWLFGTVEGVEAAIDEAHDRGLLVSDDESVWFRHELVRRAVEESLSTPLRRELNQIVLERLEPANAEIERIVHHANEAAVYEVVVRVAPEAARQASAAASHREALSHYRLAIPHLALLSDSAQAELLSDYGVECYMANSAAEGLEAMQEALDLWRSLGERRREGDTLRWQSRLHWWLGHGEQAEAGGIEAVVVLEQLAPSRELAMAYSNLGQISMLAQHFEPAERWATKAIELARRLDDHTTLAHSLNNLGSARLRIGDTAAFALLEESLEISLREGLDDDAGRAYANLIWTALDYRDYPTADRYLEEGLAFATRREVDGGRYYMMAERARFRFERGDWRGARSDVEWVLSQPEEPGITQMPARAVLARLEVRTGSPEAVASVEAAWELAEPTGELQRIAPVSAARAEHAWLRGDPAAARLSVADAYALAGQARQPWLTDELAFWMWRAGALEETPDSSTPFALQMSGDAAGAAEAWRRLGCPYEQAMALADGDEPDRLLEALQILDDLGAIPAAGMVRTKLRKLGVQGVPRGPRRQTRSHPAGLTPRQVDVLELLVEGLTNVEIAGRLFVSPKTVDHHVSAILTKLEAGSRQEAAALARTRGLIPT
ncbi:MAG: AAA family ATPase [Acidimicrobiia bacterium]|nr:AAA family ATPase [Acidimicrobiia bacterium]